MFSNIKIEDQKLQIINVPDDFEKFLLPQRQICCGPSMSGNLIQDNNLVVNIFDFYKNSFIVDFVELFTMNN